MAALVSPILGVILAYLVSYILLVFIVDFSSWLQNFPMILFGSISTAIFGLIIALPVMFLYGLPVHYFLERRQLQSFWVYSVLGYLPTTMVRLIFEWGGNSDFSNMNLLLMASFGFHGLFTALIFWFIAVHFPKREEIKLSDLKKE